MNELIDTFASLFETYAVFVFLGALLGKTKLEPKKLSIVYAVLFVALSITKFIDSSLLVISIGIVLIWGVSCFYEAKHSLRLFIASLLVVMKGLFGIIVAAALLYSTQFAFSFYLSEEFYYFLSKLFVCMLLYLFVKFVEFRKIDANFKGSRYIRFSILFFPTLTFIVLFAFINKQVFSSENAAAVALATIFVAFLILFNVLIIFLMGYKGELISEKNKNSMLQQNLDMQIKYYKELVEQHRRSNKEIHDLKNKIQIITMAISLNNNEMALEKLEELSGNVFGAVRYYKTGNDVIDALLSSKSIKFSELGIDFEKEILMSSKVNIEDFDLSVIVGNALDNAIEACAKMPEDERQIDMEILQKEEFLSIVFTNPTSEELIVIDNVVQTSKEEDKHLHGFGLQNMREIAEKYDGYMNINCEGGFFTIEFLLQNPTE